MKTKLMMIVAALTMVAFAASGAMAADLVLTVSDAEIAPGGTGTVTISVNDATGLAGAAFTIKYADPLSVTNITSDFFDTFVNQGFAAGQDGLDENGMVDSYDTPLVTAEVTDVGMRVAAARATGGEGTDVVLFTLTVAVADTATEGDTHSIEIISTTLNNTDAGYAAEGEQIDLLIADDFTVLLSKKAADEVVAFGTVTVRGFEDTDEDGIDDNWEMANFGDLTTASATTDYDLDGILDTHEAKGGLDPKVVNDPADSGDYNDKSDKRESNADVDGDGQFAINDITLFLRWDAGWTGDRLIGGRGTIGDGAKRDTAEAIIAHMVKLSAFMFDVDGDGQFAINDITLFLRWDAGWTGDRLIGGRGTIGDGAKRDTAEAIIAYLDSLKAAASGK